MDEILEEFEAASFSSSGWLIKAQELSDKVMHHLDEKNMKESLGKDFDKEKAHYMAKAS